MIPRNVNDNHNFGCDIAPSFRLWQSRAVKYCIFVRFALIILLHSRTYRQYASVLLTKPNSSLNAVLVDPWWTAHQLREDIHRDQLAYKHKLKLHNGLQEQQQEASMTTLPSAFYFNTKSSSLALRKLLSPILSTSSTISAFDDGKHNTNMLLGLLLSCIDLFVSYYLYLVAKYALWNVHVNAERLLEQSMDKAILPKKYYLFGIDITNLGDPQPSSLISYDQIPSLVSIIYFCSPISVLSSCAALSCQSITFALFLLTFHCAYMGKTWQTGLVLGILILVEQDLFFLFSLSMPVLILLLRTIRRRSNNNKLVVASTSAKLIGSTILSIFFCSLYFLYSLPSTNGRKHQIKLLLALLARGDGEERNVSPSLSLQWYFYQQVFHQFQSYFQVILEGVPYIFIIPLIIRLHRFPLALALSMLLIKSMFQPVLALNQIAFLFVLLLLNPRSMARACEDGTSSNFMYFAFLAIPLPVTMTIGFHQMWLQPHNTGALGIAGNPNYLYFQCLAFTVFYITICLQFIFASTQRDKCLRHTVSSLVSRQSTEN